MFRCLLTVHGNHIYLKPTRIDSSLQVVVDVAIGSPKNVRKVVAASQHWIDLPGSASGAVQLKVGKVRDPVIAEVELLRSARMTSSLRGCSSLLYAIPGRFLI